jgi:mono/diheme cytochrome c family protein
MRLTLAALLAAAPALADQIADGRAIAERWCATCHATGDISGSDAAPSFRTLARSRDDAALAGWMSAPPHGAMPDPGLSRAQVDALIVWIGSLRD